MLTVYKSLTLVLFLLFAQVSVAQKLKPGFDRQEYTDLLKITAKNSDPKESKNIVAPINYHLLYRSPVMGLDNCWELWESTDSIAVISVRGSTTNTESWLANFYAASVAAKGTLILSKENHFDYELASDPKAAVHTGWLVCTGFLSKDILPKIDSCYQQGIKDFFITGHSQGGGISYLLTAYLLNLQKKGNIPNDIRFKTYCSAAPKPGNLFFAYDYELKTQEGWAYNVVNPKDWVPEVAPTVQTVNDFNDINPFNLFKKQIKSQKFPKNIVLKYFYYKLDNPPKKAQRNYQKYLGNKIAQYVQKHLPEFEAPPYFGSSNYVRTGNFFVLPENEDYSIKFPDNKDNIMVHHMPLAYLQLIENMK